jgi:hypothetical protein
MDFLKNVNFFNELDAPLQNLDPTKRAKATMIFGGKPVTAELDAAGFEFLDREGEHFNFMYNRMTKEEKMDIRKRVGDNPLSMFYKFPVLPAKKNSKLDQKGQQLQKWAVQITNEAMTAMQGLRAGTEEGKKTANVMF